ncbi:HicA toxin of bacterial toxin-antitoxin [uncultured archaeon]|nr:HicA toxin of bacterial toxin-antitoxin [uncultured archaeon]
MSNLPKLSGKEIVKILAKDFGFEAIRQSGSHVILKNTLSKQKKVTVVPMHKEVKIGTLLGILDLAGIDKEEFLKNLRR